MMTGGKTAIRAAARKLGFAIERVPQRRSIDYHLAQVLGVYGVDCVLDVGANEGQFGAMLREIGYRGSIISFEPQPAVFQRLKDRTASDPGWSVYQVALSDRPEKRLLNVTTSTTVASFLEPRREWSSEWEGARVLRRTEIQASRLDDLSEQIGFERLFLKIDTQGYDLRVLAGARSLLSRVVALQIELSLLPLYNDMPDYMEALTTVRALGFVVSGFFPVLTDKDLRAREIDAVFVRGVTEGG